MNQQHRGTGIRSTIDRSVGSGRKFLGVWAHPGRALKGTKHGISRALRVSGVNGLIFRETPASIWVGIVQIPPVCPVYSTNSPPSPKAIRECARSERR